jgi:GNAT superfamily N-acetyltransferase
MGIKIKRITFEEVLPLWKKLWHPKEDIQKRSGRRLLYGFDRSVITNDNIEVTYFGAEIDGKIVGVNSGYIHTGYRSRGLYVLPEHRRNGISQALFKATEEDAKKKSIAYIWSMPRETALSAYKKFGFHIVSDFFYGEYGQNCFVMREIKYET